jgi:hypothetical protein
MKAPAKSIPEKFPNINREAKITKTLSKPLLSSAHTMYINNSNVDNAFLYQKLEKPNI